MPRYSMSDSSIHSPETGEYHRVHHNGTSVQIFDGNGPSLACRKLDFPVETKENRPVTNFTHQTSTEVHPILENRFYVSETEPFPGQYCDGRASSASNREFEEDFVVPGCSVDTDIFAERFPVLDDSNIDIGGCHSNQAEYTSGLSVNDVRGFGGHELLVNKENNACMEKKRLLVNSRERDRMKRLNEAMDRLRRVVPHYPSRKRLSKMETLLMAQNYILALTSLLQEDRAGTRGCRDAEKIAASITHKSLKGSAK